MKNYFQTPSGQALLRRILLVWCLRQEYGYRQDFNRVVVVQNYLERTGMGETAKREDDSALLKALGSYGEELVEALGCEVDRLESEIQKIVPGNIEAHNPDTLVIK